MSLLRLFDPCGIAIVGASSDANRIGGHPVRALKASGYKGGLYPVNPHRTEIQGLKAYASIAAIDGPCDMAVIAVPAEGVEDAIKECAGKGIAFAVVLSAGFREMGSEGLIREQRLMATARALGVRLIGPNCQGLISVPARVFAVFGSISEEVDLKSGQLSAAFQSGGFGFAAANVIDQQGQGLRHLVSTGNAIDVGILDLLSAYLDDPGTGVAFGYFEGITDGRRFAELGAKSRAARKPVLVWKGARSDIGSKAALSHTGSLAGSYAIFRAVAAAAGLIEVQDVEDVADIAKVFAPGRLPKGNGIGVLSVSGGSGIVFADSAIAGGLTLPGFRAGTLTSLRAIIPAFGSIENPADVTAGIFNNIGLISETLQHVLADPGVDQLSILLAALPDPAATTAAEVIAQAARGTDKPIHVAWCARPERAPGGYRVLAQAQIPILPTPGRLARAAAVLARFAGHCRQQPVAVQASMRPLQATLPDLPAGAVTLSETESKQVLRAFGVPVTREVLVSDGADIVSACRALAFPLAVKIVARDIPHKTEVGGVRLGIGDPQALATAAREVVANARRSVPGAQIEGVLVAEMAHGLEVLIGAVNDPAFGPTIVLGMGGILAEAMRDVTYRLAPFGPEDGLAMIGKLKAAALFTGWRGGKPLDSAALAQVLAQVSELAAALGDRLQELDINPVLVGEAGRGVVAADALIILR